MQGHWNNSSAMSHTQIPKTLFESNFLKNPKLKWTRKKGYRNWYSLINPVIYSKNLLQKEIVNATQYSSNDTKNNNWRQIHKMIGNLISRYVIHYQPTLSKQATFSTLTNVNQCSQYNSNYSGREECSPK